MEHKKVNFLHSVRLKMLLAMAFFAFVTGGFACALFISSTKEEIGSVTRGYMRDLSRAYGVMLDNELDTDGDDALSGEHLASILAGVQVEGVESSYIYVVSGDGTMLYHPTADKIGKPVENKAVSDAVAKIAKGEKVENEVVKYEFKGADKYAGIYVNDTQDFIMVVTADYDDVFSSIRKVEGKIGIIVLLELLIVATIGSVFAHIIVKPMNEVSELTVKVGDMDLTKNEIDEGYEKNTGLVIVQRFTELDAMAVPGVLCCHHGPFAWGKDAAEAVHNAVVMETVAEMAFHCEQLGKAAGTISRAQLDKHYFRKHGENAYYGQERSR